MVDMYRGVVKESHKLSFQARCIRAEINVLGMTLRRGGTLAVLYEFPYRAKTVDRRWTKQVEIFEDTASLEDIFQRLYRKVYALREELEA